MSTIILTVTNERKTKQIDVELPTMEKIGPLRKGLIEVMELEEFNLNTRIFVPRLNKVLNDEETLGQVGVWNGDYLVLVNHG